jgi:hypothetical protein
MKIAITGENLRAVAWVKEFLVGRSQRVRLDGKLSNEARVNSGGPQGSLLVPVLFVACVNNIWRNTQSNIRLFTDDCIIHRKITNSSDNYKLQMDLSR